MVGKLCDTMTTGPQSEFIPRLFEISTNILYLVFCILKVVCKKYETDIINVISSSSVVYMKIDAKVCFQGDHLAAIFEVRSG
jgi:hypothetical protein